MSTGTQKTINMSEHREQQPACVPELKYATIHEAEKGRFYFISLKKSNIY